MHEFEIIKKYFSKLSLNNKSSLELNDDVFFDKLKGVVVSVDTYIDGIPVSYTHLTLPTTPYV